MPVIVSDPGILSLVKKHSPKTKIHLSTQANTTKFGSRKILAVSGSFENSVGARGDARRNKNDQKKVSQYRA